MKILFSIFPSDSVSIVSPCRSAIWHPASSIGLIKNPCNLQKDYPNIHFHLYSGNAEEVTERLDKGLLDFGLLMQPADITKYDYFNLPEKDILGVVMRKDSPLAEKETILCQDLEGLPLICSRQSIQAMEGNTFVKWFDGKLEQMNIIATFSLVYNASLMVEQGLGYMITVDNLVNTAVNPDLCFRPLSPKLEAGLTIVWKKYQYFSKTRGFKFTRGGFTHLSVFSRLQNHKQKEKAFDGIQYRQMPLFQRFCGCSVLSLCIN